MLPRYPLRCRAWQHLRFEPHLRRRAARPSQLLAARTRSCHSQCALERHDAVLDPGGPALFADGALSGRYPCRHAAGGGTAAGSAGEEEEPELELELEEHAQAPQERQPHQQEDEQDEDVEEQEPPEQGEEELDMELDMDLDERPQHQQGQLLRDAEEEDELERRQGPQEEQEEEPSSHGRSNAPVVTTSAHEMAPVTPNQSKSSVAERERETGSTPRRARAPWGRGTATVTGRDAGRGRRGYWT